MTAMATERCTDLYRHFSWILNRTSGGPAKFFRFAILVLCFVGFTACSVDSAKRHYVLAEKLWTDGKYVAAVGEFDKVSARDPHGKLGIQALLRAATTQALFLSQYSEAIEKFKRFTEISSDAPAVWDARKEVGDLLFSKTDQYDQAFRYYQSLLVIKPDAAEVPEFLFRMARSQFFLGHFEDAIGFYRQLIKEHPKSSWSEHADFEIAQTLLTQGEQAGSRSGQELFKTAMANYEAFLKQYPESSFGSEAKFGIASCLEAMDQLDAAYQAYEALRTTYPSQKVIEIKLARIRERKSQRSH
jgi:TolA-binding protein